MTNWNALYGRLQEAAPSLELRRDEPMSRHTSFRVGGPVPVMALPKKLSQAKTILRTAAEFGVQPFFLGNGSNLLVSDEGAGLLVVKPVCGRGSLAFERPCPLSGRDGCRILTAWGAEPLSHVAAFAGSRGVGLAGLEFAQGIPGSVGGGVYMNAGAYGGEMSQVVDAVTVLEPDGTVRELSAQECGFGYRRSVFADSHALIWAAHFALSPGDSAEIKAKMDDFAARRREKQPLEYPSAGSTFKRPAPVDGQPVYAAALIDRCGLKGLAVGGAQVSEKHAGFIINKGGASCKDIVALMAQVRERVFQESGVTLEPEVRYLGMEGEGWNF